MGHSALERIAMNAVLRIATLRAAAIVKQAARPGMSLVCRIVLLAAFFGAAPVFAETTNEQRTLIVVVGAEGEPEYGKRFAASAELWKEAARAGGFELFVIGQDPDPSRDDRTQLLERISEEQAKPAGELWLVFIGHGTFDGRNARFNLRGPDISAAELADALKESRRTLAVIQCASASAPFMNALAGTNRVIITATKSGYEVNVTRFGDYFAQAIANPEADLDKDGQTSLLESFLMASRRVQQFYEEDGRLATEQALLDDNGDGLGTRADWFRGVRAVKTAAGGKSVDGIRAHQMNLVRSEIEKQLPADVRARRDELEQKLSALRSKKSSMAEDEYYRQLEAVLLEIARLYNGAGPSASNAQHAMPVTPSAN